MQEKTIKESLNEEKISGQNLPDGWVWIRLGEISEINPKFNGNSIFDNTEVTFLPMKCVEELTGHIDLSLSKRLSEVKKGYTSFKEGDLLFAKITPCMENGKVAIAHNLKNGIGFGSTEFHVVRLRELLPKKLFFYFLIRENLRKDAQRQMTGSAGQLRVPVNYMQQIFLPLPPLPEQHRIVAKIEELFTDLDAGVEALKKVKAELKRYRQAVLKHAFEGKLTEEWRKNVGATLAVAQNNAMTTNKGQGQALPLQRDLPELPWGWVWTRVGEIGEIITGTTPSKAKKEFYGDDLPFFKPTDLNTGYYVKKSEDGLSKKGIERARLLSAKSILVTCIGATIGKTGFIRTEGASNQQINAIIPHSYVLPEFVYFICISPQFQKSIVDNASATTLPILNKSKFESLGFPLPPLPEQHQIVSEIEKRFSVADEVGKVVDNSLKQADRLRQSILKRAFEGKLVPQDPTDEPAEKLLERIKAEKAKQQEKKRLPPVRYKVKTTRGRG